VLIAALEGGELRSDGEANFAPWLIAGRIDGEHTAH